MVPEPEHLPQVLPTDRLNARGRPAPELRAELRQIPDARNVAAVVSIHAQAAGFVWAVRRINHPVAYALAVPLAGRIFSNMAILGHEAAHRLLFNDQAANDFVGKWLLGYPAFVPFEGYRRSHFAHHKDEMGPEEPDVPLYAPYPVTRESLKRKLWRDATGRTGVKLMKPLFKALRSERGGPEARRIVGMQAAIATGFVATVGPITYLTCWLVPYLTSWRVINRLRAIAEHGGMTRSKDRRETTHHARQSVWSRFWIAPFNTGWHLAHHADMGIPFRNLPRLHDELVASGWFTEELEYPSYLSLWATMSSAPGDAGQPPPG